MKLTDMKYESKSKIEKKTETGNKKNQNKFKLV
jgi:hypothetical protein